MEGCHHGSEEKSGEEAREKSCEEEKEIIFRKIFLKKAVLSTAFFFGETWSGKADKYREMSAWNGGNLKIFSETRRIRWSLRHIVLADFGG